MVQGWIIILPRVPPDIHDRNPTPPAIHGAPSDWARDPHDQSQDFLGNLDPGDFSGAQFVGFFDLAGMKFVRSGALVVMFNVPPPHVPSALPLRHLGKQPFPLSIDVQIARRARQRADEDNTKLRLLDG